MNKKYEELNNALNKIWENLEFIDKTMNENYSKRNVIANFKYNMVLLSDQIKVSTNNKDGYLCNSCKGAGKRHPSPIEDMGHMIKCTVCNGTGKC